VKNLEFGKKLYLINRNVGFQFENKNIKTNAFSSLLESHVDFL